MTRWWQRLNELSYLSSFERRLNRTLWGLTWGALVFSVMQHVVLANIPEAFKGGARVGDLLYDLAIAYVGAFFFYLLVVRIPLRRDRRNVYRHLGPLISRVVGEARNLIGMLNEAAGFDGSRELTLENVTEACEKVGPGTQANLLIQSIDGVQYSSMIDAIKWHIDQARTFNRELLDRSSFLSSEVINLVTEIENSGYFRIFDNMFPLFKQGLIKNPDLGAFARPIFDYLQIADHLDEYRQGFLSEEARRPEYLVSGSDRPSNAKPLQRYVIPKQDIGASAALTSQPPEKT